MNKISAKVIIPALFTLGAGAVGFTLTDTCKQMLIQQRKTDMANAKAWKYEGCMTLEDSVNADVKWRNTKFWDVVNGRSVPMMEDDYLLDKYHSRHIDAVKNGLKTIKGAFDDASKETREFIDKKTSEAKVWADEQSLQPETWGILASLGLLTTGWMIYYGRKNDEEDLENKSEKTPQNNEPNVDDTYFGDVDYYK